MCFFNLELEISGKCSGTYDSATSSYITSQKYNGKNIDCTWTVKAPRESIIVLNVTNFNTYCLGSDRCDQLTIYNGSNPHEGNDVYSLRGTKASWIILATTNINYLEFIVRSNGRPKIGKGFRILLKAYGKYIYQHSVHSNMRFVGNRN